MLKSHRIFNVMSIRSEVLDSLSEDIKNKGVVFLNDKDGRVARANLNKKRINYQEARREFLRHQLARFYRIAIFGSARLEEKSDDFIFVTELSTELVKAIDPDIVTGGGPGIMKAASLGVQIAIDEANINGRKRLKAMNHGITIKLPEEEPPNEYLHFFSKHHSFATRLQEFTDITHAAYIAPGGIGTTYELSHLVQLRQVNH